MALVAEWTADFREARVEARALLWEKHTGEQGSLTGLIAKRTMMSLSNKYDTIMGITIMNG